MPENFDQLVEDAQRFFRDLRRNNNRDWFHGQKAKYDAEIKRPAELLADVVAAHLNKVTDHPHRSKIFRQHRDLRFSKDKTPYNCHLHVAWFAADAGGDDPGYFLGISPEYVTTGAGVMAFDKARLTAFRTAASGTYGEQLLREINALQRNGCRMDEPSLKRVPKPFEPDHPHGSLLRRKGVVVWRDIDDDREAGLLPSVIREFDRFQPLNTLLYPDGMLP